MTGTIKSDELVDPTGGLLFIAQELKIWGS
jgi:hypothetical protein